MGRHNRAPWMWDAGDIYSPGDLTDLPVVHGVEDRGVAHPVADPQLDPDARVKEQHGGQGEQEQSHHDEGGVRLPVSHGVPTLLTAHMVMIVQEVVLHLGEARRKKAVSPRRQTVNISSRSLSCSFLISFFNNYSLAWFDRHHSPLAAAQTASVSPRSLRQSTRALQDGKRYSTGFILWFTHPAYTHLFRFSPCFLPFSLCISADSKIIVCLFVVQPWQLVSPPPPGPSSPATASVLNCPLIFGRSFGCV